MRKCEYCGYELSPRYGPDAEAHPNLRDCVENLRADLSGKIGEIAHLKDAVQGTEVRLYYDELWLLTSMVSERIIGADNAGVSRDDPSAVYRQSLFDKLLELRRVAPKREWVTPTETEGQA